MSNILKKPYEISLWDEQLYWHRRKLVEVSVSKQNYTPGKYYSQSSIGQGARPYVLDNGLYVEGKKYYTLAPKTSGNYVEGPSASDTNVDSTFGISTLFQFYKEKKLCIIGSNTMTAPIRAVQPKFNRKISGENTLTFTMYVQYWDEETNKLTWNPLMQYLTNERKVKLKYEGKWYDFVIKNISEDSSSKAFTYTCKDLYLNELSKSGFELEFDTELENNMGTLPELAGKILEGSDWQLKEDIAVVKQYLEDPLYVFEFQPSSYFTQGRVYMSRMEDNADVQVEIPYGKKFYVFYNSINNLETKMQFIYDPKQKYQKDDKNVVIGHSAENSNGVYNYYIDNVEWVVTEINGEEKYTPYIKINETSYALTETYAVFDSQTRGERLVQSPVTHFDSKLDKILTHYNNGTIYGFTSTEYTSPAFAQNFIANPNTFTSTTGWGVGKKQGETDKGFPELIADTYPSLVNQLLGNANTSANASIYLKFTPKATGQTLVNEGINSNKLAIKEFVKGEQFYLNLDIYKEGNSGLVPAIIDTDFQIEIREYEFKNGVYNNTKQDPLFELTDAGTDAPNCDYLATCKYSLSKEQLSKIRMGVIITALSSSTLYIENLEFFRRVVSPKDGQVITPNFGIGENDSLLELSDIKTVYSYFSYDAVYTSIDDLTLLYRDYQKNNSYTVDYGSANGNRKPYEKVRSITAKESNRFNLIQSLCELFQCWAIFEIEHEPNGEISYDENYRYKKWIDFKEYIGKDNYVGFKYGINLKSIKRQLDSNGIISKIIVKANSNEFAPNGFCTIARAEENPTGENTIYNFDYYVGQKLLNFSTLNNDLYLQPNVNGYIGYYKAIKRINDEIQKKIEIRAEYEGNLAKYTSEYKTYSLSYQAAEEDLRDQKIAFESTTGQSYESVEKNPPQEGSNMAAWLTKKDVIAIVAAISRNEVIIDKHKPLAAYYDLLKTKTETERAELDRQLEELRQQKLAINRQFYKKYSRFIQEGSWISEDYMDDNLYYIDALSTLYTSSRPKVTYTIDVVELSELEEFSAYEFTLGDKTYVEDAEFFGWAYDGSSRLYREEVIVTEITKELDSPEKNVLKVQNYKTQFEDLFQRVVATTQQVQFSTGEYKRSAAIVEPGGTINITTLQNSIANNAITLQNAKDQSVIIGEDGITTTNLSRPSEMLRIVAGGIFISNDGGESWTTGISANGLNASCITAGSINAEKINITMGTDVAFRWDRLGISAYKKDTTGFSPNTFTRFDQYGIYGINNQALDIVDDESREDAMAKIKQKASFGLMWNDFWLKSSKNDGYVSISSDKDFQVIRYGENEKEVPIISIGRLGPVDSGYYGLQINNLQGQTMLETNQNGELWLRKILQVETGSTGSSVRIGLMNELDLDKADYYQEDANSQKAYKIIDANSKFKVYEDGHVEGTSVHFYGGSKFEGTIEATGGTIGGLDIEKWKEMGFSVRITSSDGLILKGKTPATTLTATLYRGNTEVTIDASGHFEDSDGTKYALEYEWFHNGSQCSTNNEIRVSMANKTNDTYTCKIYLTPLVN